MNDHHSGLVIGVVDDDRRILESLDDLLQSAGHAVRLFACAEALLENGRLSEIDCLISDIDLPRIDGFELSRRVYTARPELPVILITGHSEIVNRPQAGSAYRELLRKPLNAQELLAAIRAAVSNPDRPA